MIFRGSVPIHRVTHFLCGVILITVGHAQCFQKNDGLVGINMGIGGAYTVYTVQSPTIGLTYEHGVTKLGSGVLGIGGYVGYKNLLYRSLVHVGEAEWRYSYFITGVRGNWHWNTWHNLERLDTYGGIMVHYNIVRANYAGPELASPGFTAKSGSNASWSVGARYRMGQHWCATAELGFGHATLGLGAVYQY